PELWRDIQANVRKMDDLYDATFYTWLRSEDNVLVTASYLQRLAGEYDLERIEHALCELNRARLVLALTDNWGIQYIARLASTLLTNATLPTTPQPLLSHKFPHSHTRMSSMPNSSITSLSPSSISPPSMIGVDGNSYSSSSSSSSSSSPSTTSRSSTPPHNPRSAISSSPSSPSPAFAAAPAHSNFASQPTHGRRMAVSRRLGSPMSMSITITDDATTQGRPSLQANPLLSGRSGHYRQTSSTQHQQRQSDHGASFPSSASSNPTSPSSSQHPTPGYPTQASTSYHPHHCNFSHQHHHRNHHSQPQHNQLPSRSPSHAARGINSHARQQSQPGTISTAKQHLLQQQTSVPSAPVFYMNKTLFMEELSRKWSFCRLSEFFQFMDPSSESDKREDQVMAEDQAITGDSMALDIVVNTADAVNDVEMTEIEPSGISHPIVPPSSTTFETTIESQSACGLRDTSTLHPFEGTSDNHSNTRATSISAPINVNHSQNDQSHYHAGQTFGHSDYNDDMNSGFNRGSKPAENCHQHCRSQTVEAIMSGGLGGAGSISVSSSSSCSSSTPSPTSTSAASASLSTLTLADSGAEQSSRSSSQHTSFSPPGLYRHSTTHTMSASTPAIPTTSTSVAASSSASTLHLHANTHQRHAHDSTSTKRKNSLGVSLASSSHCSSFSSTSSSTTASTDSSMNSSSSIFPGARRTSTSASTTNDDMKRLRCSRQNSTSSTTGI
ncbi:hypothetical protein BGZ76_004364, partial [Entomortierella beljakovae]